MTSPIEVKTTASLPYARHQHPFLTPLACFHFLRTRNDKAAKFKQAK